MIIKNARLDWVNALHRGNKGKFSCCIILDENDPQIPAIQDEINKAIAKGIEKGKFTEAQTGSKRFKACLRNGTEEFEEGERPAHYKGKLFLNANNLEQPGVINSNGDPIMDKNEIYSGCYGHVDVGFFPFNNESIGVGAGLNNIMKTADGDRLDGRQSADEAFADLIVEGDDNADTDVPF